MVTYNNRNIRNNDKIKREEAVKDRPTILDTVDAYALETGHSRIDAHYIMR